MSTAQVQKWVSTVLTIAIIGHLSEAIALFGVMIRDDKTSSAIGLLVIAGVLGILTVITIRIIHKRRILSSWLLVGLTPAAFGTYFAFLH